MRLERSATFLSTLNVSSSEVTRVIWSFLSDMANERALRCSGGEGSKEGVLKKGKGRWEKDADEGG